ncbi:MAG: hypothetical protein SFW62_03195 [Alphaproteobacteria bacterium]|nr:hypothetical protein [Alphaproteobacteria bacterium]
MTDNSLPKSEMAQTGHKTQALLAAFRQIGLPLLQALAEAPESDEEGKLENSGSKQFAALIDSTALLSEALAAQFGESSGQMRWGLAGAAAQIVGDYFKANNESLSVEAAKQLVAHLRELQKRFTESLPENAEPSPATAAAFRMRMMEAMVPVVGAVAQYAFGRPEHVLLAEIGDRLARTAEQAVRSLAPPGAPAEEWRLLYWNILRAAGQVYAASHFAEADRLLYMKPDERTAYFTQHGNMPPLTPVWQIFNQRMAMLATLAAYLDVPAGARFDTEGWNP